ncbi:MAG: hypothetical protein ACREET_18455, partial [Stellaceae bacterium]
MDAAGAVVGGLVLEILKAAIDHRFERVELLLDASWQGIATPAPRPAGAAPARAPFLPIAPFGPTPFRAAPFRAAPFRAALFEATLFGATLFGAASFAVRPGGLSRLPLAG